MATGMPTLYPCDSNAVQVSQGELQVLVTYIERLRDELAKEKFLLADAELEIKDLKSLLDRRTREVERLLEQRKKKRATNTPAACEIAILKQNCQELEEIVSLLEQQQAKAETERQQAIQECYDHQLRVEVLMDFARALQDQVLELQGTSTLGSACSSISSISRDFHRDGESFHRHYSYGDEVSCHSSPVRLERIKPGILSSMSPPRRPLSLINRPYPPLKRSVGVQVGDGMASMEDTIAQLEQEVASLRKELRMVRVEQQHERQQADEAHHEIESLREDLAKAHETRAREVERLEETRSLIRKALSGRLSRESDDTTDDDNTISSTDSTWFKRKVDEFKKRMPPLATSHRIVPLSCEEDDISCSRTTIDSRDIMDDEDGFQRRVPHSERGGGREEEEEQEVEEEAEGSVDEPPCIRL